MPDTAQTPAGSVWSGPDSNIQRLNDLAIHQIGDALGLSPTELELLIQLDESEIRENETPKHSLTLLKLAQAASAK